MTEDQGREMRARVKAIIPEAVAFIRELHRLGLIAGWRNVVYVGPPREIGIGFNLIEWNGSMHHEPA